MPRQGLRISTALALLLTLLSPSAIRMGALALADDKPHAPAAGPAPAHAAPGKRADSAQAAKPDERRPVNPHTTPKTQTAAPRGAAPGKHEADHTPAITTQDPHAAPQRPAAAHAEDASGPISADQALILLGEGNQRWVAGESTNPNIAAARRASVAEHGQKPFVSILTCADSRLPVERVFDRGVGELFVVRVAGNIAGASEVGTIEYGVEHLKTPLLVVMGHTRCGAVAAAASGGHAPGHVGRLLQSIAPAVERARRNNPGVEGPELAALSVKENVWQTIFDLYKASPTVLEMVEHNELRVVGAVCDVATGRVEWLGPHPWQAELLDAIKAKPNQADAVGSVTSKH